MVWNNSLVSLGQLPWIHSLQNFFPPPTCLLGRVEEERENTLTLCEDCASIAKTLFCYPHCFSHKCKAQRHMSCYEGTLLHNLIPAKPRTQFFQTGSKRICKLSSRWHLYKTTIAAIFHCRLFLYHCSDYSWRSLSLLGFIITDHCIL